MSDSSEATESKRKRPSVTAAAVIFVVFALVCTAIAVIVRLSGGEDTASPSPSPQSPVTAIPNPSSAPGQRPDAGSNTQPAGIGVPTTDRLGRRIDIPNWIGGWALPQTPVEHAPYLPIVAADAPAGLMWQRVNDGVAVPFSTSDGPTTIDGLQASGFARTPQGAALAAAQIFYRLAAVDNRTAQRMFDEQTVMLPAQRQLVDDQLRQEGPGKHRTPADALSYISKTDAFRLLSYAEDFAVVEFAEQSPPTDDGKPRWGTSRHTVVWEGGDWKLKFQDNDTDQRGHTSTLGGWTPW
ncbi:hypothetical protein JGU71_28835 [Antrihabitans sp. YC3-6]|uniref:DUF8175 domain-containing protein n=1 Tax=Antrihabitans stalagmiti TaxID=2799499 RepID=A0A934U7D4_9NOCA|nr:hypothetical protein [Antrihabitans stalagmiti]MBJ8342903.1 hypothetical protein [Antrihabitans stalagmiti]